MRNLLVKVGMMPGKIQEVAVQEGANVADALRVADVEVPSGYTIKVNESTADMEAVLQNGDLVLVAKNFKGNQ